MYFLTSEPRRVACLEILRLVYKVYGAAGLDGACKKSMKSLRAWAQVLHITHNVFSLVYKFIWG